MAAIRRVTDMVREMIPHMRGRLPQEELDLAVHLRTNEKLYEDLTELIRSRIRGRDQLPVPSDPLACKSLMERQSELRWLLSRLDHLHSLPMNQGADEGEQPAA